MIKDGGIDISTSKYKNSEAETKIKDVSFTTRGTMESTSRKDHDAKALVKFKEPLVAVTVGTDKDKCNTSKLHWPKPNLYSTHLIFVGLSEGV